MGPRVKGERLAQTINMFLALSEPTMRSELAGGIDLSVYIDDAAAERVFGAWSGVACSHRVGVRLGFR